MTPNLSTDELLMLAKMVLREPEGSPYRWIVDSSGFVSLVNSDNEPPLLAPNVKYRTFSPRLDGEDWQVAQACRVIVAADNGECRHEFRAKLYHTTTDLLTASARALLEGKV